jgi:flagellar assembly protein FliH
MKNKWSKVSWAMENHNGIKEFRMAELVSKERREQEEKAKKKESASRHDCSDLQRQAFEQGRKKGTEEGRAQVQAEVEVEFKRAIHLANEIGRARVAALEECERDIVEVALAISQKIILRELEIDKEFIVRQVRQILSQLVNKGLVTLKVHPQDLVVLEPLHQALQSEFLEGDHLVIESHEAVQLGGCLVEQAGLQLDGRLQHQMETVATEFGLEASHL